MKLGDLKDIIFSDLTLIIRQVKCEHVWKEGSTFEKYKNYTVIGLRADGDDLVISLEESLFNGYAKGFSEAGRTYSSFSASAADHN